MRRMLMIDDDPIIRKICKTYFASKGFAVDVAENGKEGLRKFKATRYDIVITDLMMANVHGFQVIDAIKASAAGQETPIILLTADRHEAGVDCPQQVVGATLERLRIQPALKAGLDVAIE